MRIEVEDDVLSVTGTEDELEVLAAACLDAIGEGLSFGQMGVRELRVEVIE